MFYDDINILYVVLSVTCIENFLYMHGAQNPDMCAIGCVNFNFQTF